MLEGNGRLYITTVLFPDPTLITNGRALLDLAGKGQCPDVGVLPACASLLAASALELALETSLLAARAHAEAGITPFSELDLAALDSAHELSLGAKVLRVPELISAGTITVSERVGVPIRTLNELIRLRNDLVHPLGAVVDEPTDVVTTEEAMRDGSWVRDVGEASRDRVEPSQDASISIEDGKMVIRFKPVFPRFRWMDVSAESARRYLDAVGRFNSECLHALFSQAS